MLCDYITRYLGGSRVPDEEVLATMAERFVAVTYRQFMEERSTGGRVGSYPPSAATKCARANYGGWIGAPSEPLDPNALVTFWLGDLVELGVLALAQLAYAGTKHSIGVNNAAIDVKLGTEGKTRRGFVDGLVAFNHDAHEAAGFPSCRPAKKSWLASDGSETLLFECKSMGDYPFQQFVKNGPDDTWGYLGQITVYQRTLELRRFLMVATNKATGEIAEYIGSYTPAYAAKADANFDAVMQAAVTSVPPPVPASDTYGMDADGTLRLHCRFCSRKQWCLGLQGYVVEESVGRGFGGKPTKVFRARKADEPATARPFDAKAIARAAIDKGRTTSAAAEK